MDIVTRFLERRDALLPRLNEQLQEATTAHDAAGMLCEYTGRELNLGDCVVYLATREEVLIQAAAWGPKRGAELMLESRLRLPIGRGIVGECALLLQTQNVHDTREDVRYRRDEQPGLSELSVPICRDGILLGVLDSEAAETGFFDARYEQAFEAIAHCGAAYLWRLRNVAVARR